MSVVIEVRGGALAAPSGPILRDVSLDVRAGQVMTLLGPGGVGKSTLLKALAEQLPPEVERRGSWTRRSAAAVELYAQRMRADLAGALGPRVGEPATCLLLDEPDRQATFSSREELGQAIKDAASRGLAIVVATHDVTLASSIADVAGLLCDGRLIGLGSAPQFFERPASELVERFVKQGNCWPARAPTPLPLPSHFRWIEPGKLAGMGRPGLLGDPDEDLAAIVAAGIDMLVTLTEAPLPQGSLQAHGLRGRHYPISDMGVPAMGTTASLCREMERAIGAGSAVAVHCHAGLGRTGTILGAFLVWTGATSAEALEAIRRKNPGYCQTASQERFLSHFEEAFGRRR